MKYKYPVVFHVNMMRPQRTRYARSIVFPKDTNMVFALAMYAVAYEINRKHRLFYLPASRGMPHPKEENLLNEIALFFSIGIFTLKGIRKSISLSISAYHQVLQAY